MDQKQCIILFTCILQILHNNLAILSLFFFPFGYLQLNLLVSSVKTDMEINTESTTKYP